MRHSILLMLTLAACSNMPCGSGDTRTGVVSELVFARVDDAGVSNGFDLDGVTSDEDGLSGCGIADYSGPDGNSGIDNAMARLLPALDLTEAVAMEDLILQMINSGEILLMPEIRGVNDPLNDDCVDFTLWRGAGTPYIGTAGYLTSGQTFEIDPAVAPVHSQRLELVDGSMVATDVEVSIPLEIFDARLNAVLEHASVRIDWDEDGSFTGYMGGALDYWSVVEMAMNSNVDQTLAGTLPMLFGNSADLEPDETGTCQKISITFEFTGRSAFFYEDVERELP